MRITIAQENSGGHQQSFEKELVLIGRDPSECDITFERERFPMISRRHAEIRWHAGQWYVVDLNSSYGTFVDGVKLSAPMPVKVGSRIQVGQSGPVVDVLGFDSPATAQPAP